MVGYLSIPVLAVTVILQATLMPELRVSGGMPDLVFMLVLSVSMIIGLEQGLVWAIVGGSMADLLSAAPVGTTALALVVTVSLVYMVLGQTEPRSLLYPPPAAAGGTVVLHGVTLLVLVLTGRPVPVLQSLLYVTLPSIVYNTVGMVVIYRIVGSIYLSVRPRRVAGM